MKELILIPIVGAVSVVWSEIAIVQVSGPLRRGAGYKVEMKKENMSLTNYIMGDEVEKSTFTTNLYTLSRIWRSQKRCTGDRGRERQVQPHTCPGAQR